MSVDRTPSNPVQVLLARKHLAWWILGVVLLGVVAYVGYAYLPWIVFGLFAYLLGPALFARYGIFLGPLLLVAIVAFMQYILPILAHPERERVTLSSGPTLDEYVRRTKGEPGATPDSDPDDSSLG